MNAVLRGFQIRPAQKQDIDRLVTLDRIRFGPEGVRPYDHSHFECWLEINPTGLLVVSKESEIVAYRYSQIVNFSLDDIAKLTTNDAFTDSGYTRATHTPAGDCINGVSVCSVAPGAGRILFEIIFQQLVNTRRHYYFGFARINGFDAYCQHIEQQGVEIAKFGMASVARFYAMQCAAQVGGKVWDWVKPVSLPLPAPAKPDPVLGKYLRHKGFGIAAILPEWMEDKRSRNFGVMVLYKNPHLD